MVIAYQPATELAEVRKVDGWHVLPPLPAKILRRSPCADEVSEWFSQVWIEDIVFVSPTTVLPAPSLEQRFKEQADKWDKETAHLSSPSQRFTHPSYEAIRGMASENRAKVIDLLLEDMQKNRREWFWMLSYLTHENPVEGKDVGKLDKMINAWVKWGQRPRGR